MIRYDLRLRDLLQGPARLVFGFLGSLVRLLLGSLGASARGIHQGGPGGAQKEPKDIKVRYESYEALDVS